MTMDFTEKEIDLVSERLQTQPVTYHTMARDLGLSASRSKKLLTEYYKSNTTTVNASFIATGYRGEAFIIHNFESESGLEENLALTFDKVMSVQIYCIHLKKTTFTHMEIALEELRHPTNLDSLSERHKLGLIKGPDLIKSCHSPQQEGDRTTKSSLPLESSSEKKKATSDVSPKPGLLYRSSKPVSKPASLISSYVSRKGENSSTTKKRPGTDKKPTLQYKSRKLEQSEPKERVVVSNLDAEEDVELNKTSTVASTSHSDLHNLFLDDDFTDEEKLTETKETQLEEESEPIAVNAEPSEVEEPQKIDAPKIQEGSILRSFTSSSKDVNPELQELQNLPPQETTVDEDGYFTLYKQTDTEKTKPTIEKKDALQQRKPTPKVSTNKGDTKKKQASLMSFFGKR